MNGRGQTERTFDEGCDLQAGGSGTEDGSTFKQGTRGAARESLVKSLREPTLAGEGLRVEIRPLSIASDLAPGDGLKVTGRSMSISGQHAQFSVTGSAFDDYHFLQSQFNDADT